MKRGVIIDLKDDFAIVLTADGHFVKTRDVKSHYQLGEEITFNAAEASRAASPKRRGLFGLQQLRIGFVTAIAIILIFFSLYPVFNSDKVYAYMTIDINPSFELAINGNMEVVKLEPLNEDGEKLLSSFPNWNKQGFQSVVNSIINQSRTMGYTKSGKEIFITTVVDRKNDKKFEANLLNRVQMMKSTYKADPLIIETVQSDMETRKKAKSEGVSTGTYIRNHKPSEKRGKSSDDKENKPVPGEKPDNSITPAPKVKESKPESDDKTCKAPSCRDQKPATSKQKPATGKQEPDPKALKEMEKKGKQPPAVPPKRDEPAPIPAPKQERNENNTEQRGFIHEDEDSGEDDWEKEENDDSHSEDYDDEDENNKKKDKQLKDEFRKNEKNKDQRKANKQIQKAAEEPYNKEKSNAKKLNGRVKSPSNKTDENYSAPDVKKNENNLEQEPEKNLEQGLNQEPDPALQELNPASDSSTFIEPNEENIKQDQLK